MDEGAVCQTDELALMEQLLGFPCSMSVDLSAPSLSSLAVMGTTNLRPTASVWLAGPSRGAHTPPNAAPATTAQLTNLAPVVTAADTVTAAALPTAPRPRVRREITPAGSSPPPHRGATSSPALAAAATSVGGHGDAPVVSVNQLDDNGDALRSPQKNPSTTDKVSPGADTVADGEMPREGEDDEDELEADPELWADAKESGTPRHWRTAHDQLPRGTTAAEVEAALRARIGVLQSENAALAAALTEATAAAEASAAAAAAAEARTQAAGPPPQEGCAKCARRRARAAARGGSRDGERRKAKKSETVAAVAAAEVGSSVSSSPSSPPTPPRLSLPVEAAAKALWALGETPTWALRPVGERP